MTRPRHLVLLALPDRAGAVAAPRPRRPSSTRRRRRRSFEQKMRWILQLEDQRQLRGGGGDLLTLLDRSRSARPPPIGAGGRPRQLPEAIPALTTMLQSDADPEVRQMAAFAMGLIGDAAAAPALDRRRSTDPDPLIQGRAAEALGMIAHKPAAQPIGAMIAAHVNANALSGINPDDMGYPKASAVEAVRLGIYALVRLGSYDALAARSSISRAGRAAAGGRWRSRFQRINDPRAAARAARSVQRRRAADARVCGARPWRVEGSASRGAAAGRRRRRRSSRLRSASRRCAASRCSATPAAAPSMRRLITSPKVDQNLQLEAIVALAQLTRSGGGRAADRPGVGASGRRCAPRRSTRSRKTDVDTFISVDLRARSRRALVGARLAGRDARRPRPRARAGGR